MRGARALLIILICAVNSVGHGQQKSSATKFLTDTISNKLLMKEEAFWKIIEEARTSPEISYQSLTGTLRKRLSQLGTSDLEKFNNTFVALLDISYTYKLLGAACVINGGCSDDCFEEFRQYLVSNGRKRYYQALRDPENCTGWIKNEEYYFGESIQRVVFDIYQDKTGKELPRSYMPEYKPKGQPFDEDQVHKNYPKLQKKFWGSSMN